METAQEAAVTVSEWIAFAALAVAAVTPAAAAVRSAGRRDGKVDAVLEQLAAIAADHEDRLRRGRL
jgi:hypothetical protein